MKNKYRILRITASIIIVVFIVTISSVLFCGIPRNNCEHTVNSFFNEKENTLDYVVVGASGTRCDIFPTVIWNDYKITGNTVHISGFKSNMYIYLIRDVLANQKESLLIVDLDGFLEGKATTRDSARLTIDTLPYADNAMKDAVNDLDSDYRMEHFIPIIRYHNNFTDFYKYFSSDLTQLRRNINKETDCMKGAISQKNIDNIEHEYLEQLNVFSTADINYQSCSLDENAKEDLIEVLDYCKSNKIDNVLFINLPKGYYDEKTKESNSKKISRAEDCKEIIEGYGYDYYNACDNESGLTNDDFCDTIHLKEQGAIKFSKWLGEYLSTHYNFKDKNQEVIDAWNESSKLCYEKYGIQ